MRIGKRRLERYSQELERIRRENGGKLLARDVVNAARKPHSILHGWFDWDSESAHEKFLIQQAGQLIGLVEVELLDYQGNPAPARRYLNVKVRNYRARRAYVTYQDVRRSVSYQAQCLLDALAELETWVKRHRTKVELKPMLKFLEDNIPHMRRKIAGKEVLAARKKA